MPPGRGGRGGGGRGGGRGGSFNPARGTVTIAGTELNWDLTGLDIQKGPAERFPDVPVDPPAPPTADEARLVRNYITVRDRIHEGPFYTVLNDGMRNGLKRKANDPAPTAASLFNPFTDNQTYSAKYFKVRRKLPKLDERTYVTSLFPAELRPLLEASQAKGRPLKKRKLISAARLGGKSHLERLIESEQERINEAEGRGEEEYEDEDEEEAADDKPDAVDEEDNWSAASTDSEESDDDYNAEQYFDNGEDDDIDDGDPYENTYE